MAFPAFEGHGVRARSRALFPTPAVLPARVRTGVMIELLSRPSSNSLSTDENWRRAGLTEPLEIMYVWPT